MTGFFSPEGKYIPVTVIELGPCVVTQVKSKPTDGYNALQLGFGSRKAKQINKPMAGHLKKSKGQFGFLREVPVEAPEGYEVGQSINLHIF